MTTPLQHRESPFTHLCFLVSEALRMPARPAPPTESAPLRRSWLERLEAWTWRQRQKEREAYLAQSKDLADLEARLRALERGRVY